MTHADLVGLLAGALVLATFATTNMVRLRTLAILSNLAFLAYAALLSLWPVLILHGLLLPVNLVMLTCAGRKQTRKGRAVPSRPLPFPAAARHVRPRASAARRFPPTTNNQPG